MDVEKIRTYIRREFLFDPDAELADDAPLVPDLVDSLGLMDLVSFVEETYEVQIDESELVRENFGSIAAVVRLVESKQG